jgi:AcrR family transcriptional regulator
MTDTKETILIQNAAQVFMKFGIKSVNMDDMARHLNMSKKTLYVYVQDKEELVRKAVIGHCEVEDREIKAICRKELNAIEEQFEIMHWVLGMLRNVHPSIIFDLEKYHPEVYAEMMKHRHRAIFDCMTSNMKKGQKEGLYRKDFNPELIARFYIARLDLIFDKNLYSGLEWDVPRVYLELFRYHIRGIASKKGIEFLDEKKKNLKY